MTAGESIPIRVFLAGYDLTPTMRDINKKFSVRYFLNLVLMDTEDRRYFKQQEITLWRKADKNRKSAMTSSNNPHVPSHLVGSDGEIMTNKQLPSTNSISSSQSQADDNMDNDASPSDGKCSGPIEKSVGLFQEESPDQGTPFTKFATIQFDLIFFICVIIIRNETNVTAIVIVRCDNI